MLSLNYTENFLGLEDVESEILSSNDFETNIYLKTKLKTQVCPNCRHDTKRVHDYQKQIVKDLDSFGKHTILHLTKRRYYCKNCGNVFMEKISFLPRYQRNTKRLVAKVMVDFGKPFSTKNIADMHNISPGVARRIFDRISYPSPKLPKVLSIDEFKGNAARIKFQCILTDPVKKKVLDILPSKRTEDICSYFFKYSIEERRNVEFIVMDMSPQFMDIMRSCFPRAKIVVDKFHVCRHVTWAIENVRKREQKKFGDDRRRYFKRSRWVILRHGNKLNPDDLLQLEGMLEISHDLREAYALKECFYGFMGCKDIEKAKKELAGWNLRVGIANLEEFNKCFNTVNRWQPYILRAFSTGYTNGYTEGVNNKIKVLKRICYGVRNFDRFRNRILHLMAA